MNDPNVHLLSQSLGSLSVGVAALEAKYNRMSGMLDQSMDLHNELSDWACNTEHSEAAAEIMTILEGYTQPGSRVSALVSVPMTLSRSN